MSYLLDTNHCVYLLNGWNKREQNRKPQEQRVVSKIASMQGKQLLYMSDATLGELYFGAYLSAKKAYNLKRIELLQEAVFPLAVNDQTWRVFGETKALLKTQGNPLADLDLLIAATAKTYGLTLVTNDADHKQLPKGFPREDWATETGNNQ